MRVIASADPRATAFGAKLARVAAMIVLGALLVGCDRCGDWWWSQGQSQACRQQAPRPQ
jgi:hypothetical protein